jgi:hypothetical protein
VVGGGWRTVCFVRFENFGENVSSEMGGEMCVLFIFLKIGAMWAGESDENETRVSRIDELQL